MAVPMQKMTSRWRRRLARPNKVCIDNDNRVDITGMESVIATGLGAVDYLAAGTNDPELSFNNQQNHRGLGDVNLDLRGLNTDNTLYADAGDDVIEGRSGDDLAVGWRRQRRFRFLAARLRMPAITLM
jgi:hypothetical protein